MTKHTMILVAAIFLWQNAVIAQITSGTIDYNERMQMEMGEWMSKDQKKEFQKKLDSGDFDGLGRLSFNDTAFSYKKVPIENNKENPRGRWFRENREPNIYYTNYKDSMLVDRRRIMDKVFILEDKWITPDWHIAKANISMKDIPLPTRLATAVSTEGDTLTAYYTPSIPLPIGPRGYGGLPGAIVYLKVQKGRHSTEYKMLSMQPSSETLSIKKPEDAEKISREKYEKYMKRAQEMRERRRRNWRRN